MRSECVVKCKKCGSMKSASEFYVVYVKRNGFKSLDCMCTDCRKETSRAWNSENKERHRKRTSNWQKDPKNRFKLALRASEALACENGYVACDATLIDLEESFTGRCDICGVPEEECARKLSMDHNHETGEFRGWLCGKCNTSLGGFCDSQSLLASAIEYLVRTNKRVL